MPEHPHSLQDTVLHNRLKEVVRERGIKCVVETGLDRGLSTVKFSKMADVVFGIDNAVKCLVEAHDNLGKAQCTNAVLCCGSSPAVLYALRPVLPRETLYFLDAHWQAYWPLRDEIAAITPGHGVIVIHDMKVPGHPELGFDSYGGHDLDIDYVRGVLERWSPLYRIEHNERVEGTDQPRGCGIIYPE